MLSPKIKTRTGGFTLVELLMVVTVIAILSTLSLAVLRSAQQDARSAATDARLTQAKAILSLYLEDFEYRRLPFRLSELEEFVIANPVDPTVPTLSQVKNLRRRILADYINVEMPRDNSALGQFPSPTFTAWLNLEYATVRPSDNITLLTFLQRYETAIIKRWQQIIPARKVRLDNHGELLYHLLGMIDYQDQNGLEAMGMRAVGDSDADAEWELVDSWGDSLQFAIKQVDATPSALDSWVDVSPEVMVDLNVEVPRSFHHFRFDVWSDNVPRIPLD